MAHDQQQLTELFTQSLGVLSAEGLITLERVMHDGTKTKASAGADRQFHLRGLVKARLEALWACLTYNIQQWIR